MGEPALQLPEEDQPDIRPHLSALEGGGETTPAKLGHLSVAGGSDREAKLFNQDDETQSSENSSQYGPSALDDIKSKLGGGRGSKKDKSDKKSMLSRMFSGKSRSKKYMAIAGGTIAASIIASIFAFLALLPLKIESIVTNLETRFGASSSQALGDESERMLNHWIKREIMPNLLKGTCRTTANPGCVSVDKGTGPVSKLYNAWKQGKIEQKLAENHSLIISREGNNLHIIVPNAEASLTQKEALAYLNSPDNDITKLVADHNFKKTRVTRAELRQHLRQSLKEGTLWDRSYNRFVYGKYLEKKYGVRRCTITCKFTDTFTDSVNDKKLLARAVITQRVIAPLSANYAFILQCAFLGGSDCGVDLDNAADGERESAGEKSAKSSLQQLAQGFGSTELKDLVAQSEDISKKGLTGYFTDKLVTKFVSMFATDATADVTGKVAVDAIPYVGWVIVASQVAHAGSTIGPTIRYLSYSVNAAAAVQLYTVYNSSASEMKSGRVDPTELGSLADSLSGNLSGSKDDRSDATQTPLYNAYNSSASGAQTALFGGGKAYAASAAASSSYSCSNGKPVPAGKLVCDEELLSKGNGFFNGVTSAFDAVIGSVPGLHTTLEAIYTLSNLPGKGVGWLLGLMPGSVTRALCDVATSNGCTIAEIEFKQIGPVLMQKVVDVLINSPFSGNMSGGRIYDMMAAGADVSHNQSCQTNLGCAKVSSATAAKTQNSAIAEQRAEFRQQPLFARMFGTDSPYSLTSQVALAMPASANSARNQLIATLTQNPLNSIGQAFGTLFSGFHANAATGAVGDPFGVTQTGYESIPDNPEAFWNKNCVNGPYGKYDGTTLDTSDWQNDNNNSTRDEQTGQQVYLKTNPCQLILQTVISDGASSDPSLIPEDAKNHDPGDSSGGGASFRVATYNTLRNTDGKHNREICGHSGLGDNRACYERRAQLQAQIIQGKSNVGGANKPFDVFIVNETTDLMYRLLKSNLSGYDSVRNGSLAVFWRSDTFTKFDSGIAEPLQIGPVTKLIHAPWVGLKTSSGRQVFVLPLHYASYFGGNESVTTRSAEKTVAWAKSKADGKSIVIVAGDISIHANGPERVFANSGVVKNAGILAGHKNPPGADQIYISPLGGLTVTNWTRPSESPGSIIVKASDHAPVFADVSVAGDDAAAASAPGKSFVGADGFGGGNCVDYIKYILTRHSSKFHGGHTGNGKDVASNLGKLGYKVDHTPAIHATVSFPTSLANPIFGHVALVAQINKDGSIVVEESNWSNPNRYGTHTVKASNVGKLTYAHTEVGWH